MRRLSIEEKIGIIGTLLVHVVLGVLLYFLVLRPTEPVSDPLEDETEVLLDVEIVHEEEPLSGGDSELAESNESKELNEPESSVEPVAEATPQEQQDNMSEDKVESQHAESSSEESQHAESSSAADKKLISTETPEPSVNPVELDKTVDDVVERVTKFKKKVANKFDEIKKKVAEQKNKQKQTKKENQVKKDSDAVAEALKNNGDKTADNTSPNPSPSNSPSPSPASGNPGLPDIKLTDRKLVGKPVVPKYVGDEDGRIVVDICVNADGYVTQASCNRKESNISDPKLRKEAEKAAMKTRFSEAVNNKNDQWGTITYNFTKKI